jgi:acyl CoA:acetate/3-ketoacid CoA transferase alpha subunit
MDTIVGFDATKEGSTLASTSDILVISATQTGGSALTLNGTAGLVTDTTHVAGISVLALNASDSTLDLAFVHAAKAATTGNVVEFVFGGNTYLFADTNHNGVLDNSDFALKLVGTIDVTGQFGLPPATA